MRFKIIYYALRKNWLLGVIPLIILYLILPIIVYQEYLHSGINQSLYTLIWAAQALIPVSCLLLPMAHFIIWFHPNSKETLVAYSPNHSSCLGEMLIICLLIAILLFPAILQFKQLHGILRFEYFRIYAQCLFSLSLFYLCTVYCLNAILGVFPVVVYLFFCICLNDISEYKPFFILDLHTLADNRSILKITMIYFIALFLLFWGHQRETESKLSSFNHS